MTPIKAAAGDRVTETLRMLQASSCFRGGVCSSLPCACAETLASLPQAREAGEPVALTEGAEVYYCPRVKVTVLKPPGGNDPNCQVYVTSDDIGTFWTEASTLSATASPPPIHDAAVGAIEKILFDHFYTGEPGQHEAMAQAAKALRALKPQDTGSEK